MTDRARKAIDRLGEALHELSYQGRISIKPDARLLLCPGEPKTEDVRHLHAIGLSAEVVELLAGAVEKLIAERELYAAASEVAQHTQMARAVDAAFADIDLNQITTAVLNETAPQDHTTVTRALNELFGATEDDQEAED